MSRWDFEEFIPTKREKRIPRENFLKKFIKCDQCGYNNKKDFIKDSGICNNCGKILDIKARIRYELKKVNRRYKND